MSLFFFFFNDTATTEIYTLSLHDALPISRMNGHEGFSRRCVLGMALAAGGFAMSGVGAVFAETLQRTPGEILGPFYPVDRKSTRLNSSHGYISYAVFCLKKKKQHILIHPK